MASIVAAYASAGDQPAGAADPSASHTAIAPVRYESFLPVMPVAPIGRLQSTTGRRLTARLPRLTRWRLRCQGKRQQAQALRRKASLDQNLWTFNSRVFPGIDPMVVRKGDRVRIRAGNLSMTNHPLHIHSHRFEVAGTDGGWVRPWDGTATRKEVWQWSGPARCRLRQVPPISLERPAPARRS